MLQRNFWNIYCIFKLFCKSFKWLPVFQFWELMSKNEILRTISCMYFMKIWVNSWFSTSKIVLISTYFHIENHGGKGLSFYVEESVDSTLFWNQHLRNEHFWLSNSTFNDLNLNSQLFVVDIDRVHKEDYWCAIQLHPFWGYALFQCWQLTVFFD